MKNILILLNLIALLAISCSSSESKEPKETATFNVDFSALFGSTNANDIADNSYLKVSGTYGDIDGKFDTVTGATTPAGIPKLYAEYVGKDGNLLNNRIELGLGEFLLFGATETRRYADNGVSGEGFAQRSLDEEIGPIVNGTGITKDENGVITIKYAHAPGATTKPYLFIIKTDENGVFKVGQGSENFKRSRSTITNDVNFDDVELIVDKPKRGLPYWTGDLQATYENNILTIKGTLVETNK